MTAPGPAASLWKTSCFVSVWNSTAINDLTGERLALTGREEALLSRLRFEPAAVSSDAVARSLADRRLLVPAGEDESRRFSVRHVDIETTTHCNARCQYCRVSVDPKPKQIMTPELYREIVSQIAPYRPEWVSLNAFSEPLLDPHFLDRCRALDEAGLRIGLFTNATSLRAPLRQYLAKSGVLQQVVINFASANAEEWGELMGLHPGLHATTVENMLGLAEIFSGPISISVHGHNTTHHRRRDEIAALFARFPHVTIVEFPTNTMAGTIGGELVGLPTVTKAPRLAGCDRLASHVHISCGGDLFICCLDYDQKYKFGNLAEASIPEILGGELARKYRRQVYGLEPAEPDLICRECCHIRIAP